ncbi:MAG: DUF3078 domain-containing protein [Pseudoflavonifractor sp.]|nr:DUF3078 domain-containing protein [Alloprevotella sp.]MCM1116545.1 DUF3078 domain-containing protein [Pseudoflavonifractor sp.]
MYRLLFIIIFATSMMGSYAKADVISSREKLERILGLSQQASTTDTLSALEAADTLVIVPSRHFDVFTPAYLTPLIFDTYHYMKPLTVIGDDQDASIDLGPEADWLSDLSRSMRITNWGRQQFVVDNPALVPYIKASMTRIPSHLRATVQPGTNRIVMKELPIEAAAPAEEIGLTKKERRWLHVFNASLQFSQAYLSPNWYQGGNNNVNAIAQIYWNVKLNEKFYPKLLFEMTTQYKLGVNSAPDDTIRDYNISDDLFQWNAKFGYKAAHNWYYSINSSFKTQVFNNYSSNSRNLRAAFLSPGELNVGVGMTYSKKTKRVEFGASVNPLSYNLKTCINDRLNASSFGIKEGHTSVSQYGSNAELNFKARLSLNITYSSRLFLFTNYEYMQGDWQNTLSFDINRFLATQIFWNLRYDTSTARIPDSRWHRFQFKEILSFGLSYKFSTV